MVLKAQIERIEQAFVIEDLSNILRSMEVGATSSSRVSDIVISLRNFARLVVLDIAEWKKHTMLDAWFGTPSDCV